MRQASGITFNSRVEAIDGDRYLLMTPEGVKAWWQERFLQLIPDTQDTPKFSIGDKVRAVGKVFEGCLPGTIAKQDPFTKRFLVKWDGKGKANSEGWWSGKELQLIPDTDTDTKDRYWLDAGWIDHDPAGFVLNFVVKQKTQPQGSFGPWAEITKAEYDYLQNRPEGAKALRVPKAGEWFQGFDKCLNRAGTAMTDAQIRAELGEVLSGKRWITSE